MAWKSAILVLYFSALAQAAPLAEARNAWTKAWADTPTFVSLGKLEPLSGTAEQIQATLKARLKALGRKTFSNREWKAYWEDQKTTATAFAKQLEQSTQAPLAKGLRAWAGVAQAKIKNQDLYLTAIETERDAVEERLEAAMADDEKVAPSPAATATPTPFQQRQAMIADLRSDLKLEEARSVRGQNALKLIAQQRTSTSQLLIALKADVALALREASIAKVEAGHADPDWANLWSPIAQTVGSKATNISKEVELGADRLRGLKIEETLAQSQIAYRRAKIGELTNKLGDASSLSGWREAILATASRWVTQSLWKVLLALFGIWLLLRLALRLIARLGNTLEHVADDGDDDSLSQAEQRAGTIASVFRGIAIAAVYGVAGLTALEVIGINTGPIVGSVAILGLAISFGSQNLVKDVVNGFFILIENQYAVGDVVDISGCKGTVEKINLRSTRVRQYDGTLHVIPNGQINSVANCTRDWARSVVVMCVGYDADMVHVETVVNRVGQTLYEDEEWADVLEESPNFVGVVELADSSVNVRCVAKTKAGAQWVFGREFQRRLKEAFDEEGIDIPFPQRVMHARS